MQEEELPQERCPEVRCEREKVSVNSWIQLREGSCVGGETEPGTLGKDAVGVDRKEVGPARVQFCCLYHLGREVIFHPLPYTEPANNRKRHLNECHYLV